MTASRKKRSIAKSKYYFVYRSAITGNFVSKEFADKNPFVTMRHRVERKSKE